MNAVPIYEPGYAQTHHWNGGIYGYEERPELKAIVENAQGLSERPRSFKVGNNVYTLSDRVWNQIRK